MIRFKTNPWAKLQDFVFAHRRITLVLIGAMLVAAAGIIWAAIALRPQAPITAEQPRKAAKAETPPQKYYAPLTGKEVSDQAAAKRQVTAVIIENNPVSRPQSGLKDSGVVFEAIAEGGITRFLVLYQDDRPSLVGPVRSLRPYYVDWFAAFDASIAHVGGSKNALDEVRNGSYKDIDQFFNGAFFWRATDRFAPHNVYTNFDKLDELNRSKGYNESTFTGFARKLERPAKNTNATKIDVPVSSGLYNVSYEYDSGSNTYLRSVGGQPHTDREAGRIAPKTVAVIKVPMRTGFEDGYREQMDTIGHNTAYVFQDGIVQEGLWRKTGKRDQIQFYDKNARPILLNPGQTWITVMAPDRNVTWQ